MFLIHAIVHAADYVGFILWMTVLCLWTFFIRALPGLIAMALLVGVAALVIRITDKLGLTDNLFGRLWMKILIEWNNGRLPYKHTARSKFSVHSYNEVRRHRNKIG